MIIRRTLLEKGLPIHWYTEIMYHESSAIRELAKDTLQIVNAANLVINSYGAADLPGDFKDDVMVGIPVGELLQPIAKKDSISPLRLHNTTTGAFQSSVNQQNIDTGEFMFFGINTSFFWYWNVNEYGEATGRYFGANGGAYTNGYKIIKNRRQIQFTGTFSSENVVLLYVSNGQHIDNATQVDWDAFRAIQTYSEWQRSEGANDKDSREGRTYYNEKRLLRANKNDMTQTDIINIYRSNYTAAMKT
jgi:hypothetical protein